MMQVITSLEEPKPEPTAQEIIDMPMIPSQLSEESFYELKKRIQSD